MQTALLALATAAFAWGIAGCGDHRGAHADTERIDGAASGDYRYDRSRDPRYYQRSDQEREDARRLPYSSIGSE